MKKAFQFLIILVAGFFSMQSLSAQTVTDSVKVNGNCGMCKKTIEKSALAAGATTANWDKKTKFLLVSFDPSKSNTKDIQKSVAEAGYDTQDFKGDDKAYKALEECCQYDRKVDLKAKK